MAVTCIVLYWPIGKHKILSSPPSLKCICRSNILSILFWQSGLKSPSYKYLLLLPVHQWFTWNSVTDCQWWCGKHRPCYGEDWDACIIFFYEFIALHYISLAISPLAQPPQRVVFLTYLRCKLLINNAIPHMCTIFYIFKWNSNMVIIVPSILTALLRFLLKLWPTI